VGILSKLFGKPNDKKPAESTAKHEIIPKMTGEIIQNKPEEPMQSSLMPIQERALSRLAELSAHPDLLNLLWWGDGPMKNYTPNRTTQRFTVLDFVIEISTIGTMEPSLLSTKEPVEIDVNPTSVESLSYFPSYGQLSPQQRGVYWQFLRNPYLGKTDIGYVFILYYGLERHLLTNSYENAFRVILKLRDVYSNKSFQAYSGAALIVSCLMHKRIDLLSEFFASLDKDYEFNFSANLFLLSKIGLGLPITARDLMRMAKDFEFTNVNYIKKYPDMFEQTLHEFIQRKYGVSQLDISGLVGSSEWKKAPKVDVLVFANISIESRTIPIPQAINVFKLKKAAYDLLEMTHNAVKSELAELRKEGISPTAVKSSEASPKKIASFDTDMEKKLIAEYRNADNNPITKHFALLSLQDFYYRYRNLDSEYLEKCIQYCEEDLDNLDSFTNCWRKQNNNTSVRIPAFQRLSIIFEKQKDYKRAIHWCEKAEQYYQSGELLDLADEFIKRKGKLDAEKQKMEQKKSVAK